MAITIDDFSKIWASTSPLTPYEFSENNYKSGWNFIGSTPPSRQMWDFLQKNNDEKMQYLADNYLPLSGGTMTGNNAQIIMSNGESYIVSYGNGIYLGGTGGSNASTFALFTNANGNGFQLNAGNGTTQKSMVGKPDGTLTWNDKAVIVGTEATETFNNISIGANGGYSSVTLSRSAKYATMFVSGTNTQKVIPHFLGTTTVYLVNLHTSNVTASLTVNYIY